MLTNDRKYCSSLYIQYSFKTSPLPVLQHICNTLLKNTLNFMCRLILSLRLKWGQNGNLALQDILKVQRPFFFLILSLSPLTQQRTLPLFSSFSCDPNLFLFKSSFFHSNLHETSMQANFYNSRHLLNQL
jgi:hypothetical protein